MHCYSALFMSRRVNPASLVIPLLKLGLSRRRRRRQVPIPALCSRFGSYPISAVDRAAGGRLYLSRQTFTLSHSECNTLRLRGGRALMRTRRANPRYFFLVNVWLTEGFLRLCTFVIIFCTYLVYGSFNFRHEPVNLRYLHLRFSVCIYFGR